MENYNNKNGTFCFEVVSSFRQVRKNQNFLSESDHEVDINPSKPAFLFQDSLSTVQAAVQDLLSFQTIFHCVVFFAAGPSQGKTSVLCTSLKSFNQRITEKFGLLVHQARNYGISLRHFASQACGSPLFVVNKSAKFQYGSL